MASGSSGGPLLGERYRLRRVLGTGGMASVWLAFDERLRRQVAVKLLSDTLAVDESYLTRFRREARLAAGLSHPNLVGVYDFGGEGERPYLVMEYVEGETLTGRIAEGTARELDSGQLARELLGALDHIHAAGIVHRDIKSGNVLIAPDGTAKVTDFGIAQPEDATRLTSTGLVIGTRSYLAPEVMRGEPATVRSDLYSCAMVLQEAIGEPVPRGLASLLPRLGDEDPTRRPESASQALAALAASTAPTGPGASAPTERLPPDGTAPTVPVGARISQIRPDPRLLGGVFLAALIVLLVLLLSGGDDSPSPERGGSRSAQGEERDQRDQAPAASSEGATTSEPTVTETAPPGTSETPKRATGPAKPKKVKPPKAKKVKPPKASKSPPGQAKRLSNP